MRWLAIFIAIILPKKVQYYAMLEYADKAPFDFIEIEDKNLHYTFRIEKAAK